MDSPLANTFGNRIHRALTSANDYHVERHRINKRLAKARDVLSLKNKNTKNYKKKEISEQDFEKNPRVADILLLTIERDVLYALETKVVIEVQSSKAKEKFIISKYRRAIDNSIKLLSIIEAAEDSAKSQAYIYVAIIQGSYSIFRKKWQEATYALSLARVGLQSLSAQDYPHKEILTEIVDNVIDPSLKVALYNTATSQSSTPNLNQISKKEVTKNTIPYLTPLLSFIDQKLLEQEDEDMETIREITWSNFTAAIHDDDTSRLVTIAEKNSNVALLNASAYDPALLSWQDLLDHHTAGMDKQADLADEEIQDNQILLTYINYKLNFLKIQRDLTLIEEFESKPSSKSSIKKSLKILDNILLNLKNSKELPGVYNDERIWKNLEIYEKYFNIIKINKLSDSYLTTGKYKEALALIYESSKLSKSLDSNVLDDQEQRKLPKQADLDALTKFTAATVLKLQILAEHYSNVAVNDHYYSDDLKTVPNDLNKLVNVKEFQMVHQKPVLFDVAFNYINYENDSEETKEKKSFFGLFGGNR